MSAKESDSARDDFHRSLAGSVSSPSNARFETPQKSSKAFTIIELITVMAIVMVLMGMILPTLVNSKSRSQGIQCLSNTKQLTAAWLMYAADYDDRLPPNQEGSRPSNPGWALGWEDWRLSPNNTNLANLRGSNAMLSLYLDGNAGIFKCPSDKYLSPMQKAAGWDSRVRSYSMNGQIGDVGNAIYDYPDYQRFMRLADMNAMSASKCFVFVDEHPDSINDGWFWVMMGSNAWCDLPASYHNGAASFSFADGHTELKKWQFDYTKQPILYNNLFTRWQAVQPDSQLGDIVWVQERTSVKK